MKRVCLIFLLIPYLGMLHAQKRGSFPINWEIPKGWGPEIALNMLPAVKYTDLNAMNNVFQSQGVVTPYFKDQPFISYGLLFNKKIYFIRNIHAMNVNGPDNDSISTYTRYLQPRISSWAIGFSPISIYWPISKTERNAGRIELNPLVEFTTEKVRLRVYEKIHDGQYLSNYLNSFQQPYRHVDLRPGRQTAMKIGLNLTFDMANFFAFDLSYKHAVLNPKLEFYSPKDIPSLKLPSYEFGFIIRLKIWNLYKLIKDSHWPEYR